MKKNILLVTDCDGVLTPIYRYYTNEGRYFNRFCSHDSYAIKEMQSRGIKIVIMTSSFKWSGIVKARADEWGVEVIVSDNKAKDLKDITSRKTYSVIYYVGDGPEDIEVIDIVDKFFAPKNSRPEILELKDRDNFIYIPVEGGEGVLDYVKDYILR